ncbi:MAG: DUF5665 domain-containing protein [Candidatus Eremiobacteraeota bacterium]|nr:DUF5665 domain-containing protein [Candidatus Eremiobacteraeota bacterium]MDQ2818001.1 DUF5665 domain-containing protein [Candidatus Eremiobacteraeota bacterium]
MKAQRELPEDAPPADEMRATLREIDRLAKIVERMNLGDYVGLLQRPARLLWINFLAGLARGLGTVLGATLLFSLIIAVVGKIIALHLPGVSRFLEDFLRLFHSQGPTH